MRAIILGNHSVKSTARQKKTTPIGRRYRRYQSMFSRAHRTGSYNQLITVLTDKSRNDDADASALLGVLYDEGAVAADGSSVQRDALKAARYLKKGVAGGSPIAMVSYGARLMEAGRRKEAEALFRRASRAGDATAALNLGLSYLETNRRSRGIAALQRSSRLGSQSARLELAKLQLMGGSTNQVDRERAIGELCRIARSGIGVPHEEREATMIVCALLLRQGWGVRRAPGLARELLHFAAEAGSDAARVLADTLGDG